MAEADNQHVAAAQRLGRRDDTQRSALRRSWHAMADIFSPFSSSALASLPKKIGKPRRSMPQDDEAEQASYGAADATQRQTRRAQPRQNNTDGELKIEPKVWLANERTWVSYLNIGMLLGSMALVLFNAASDNVTRYFAYTYAVFSVLIMGYGYVVYQHRITMIRRRDPGHFDQILGPVVICALLFVAILSNFLIRWREARSHQP
ncbi:hypothetical protein BKA62DRAFT_290392 [Auriculariales sp. MPI-PUGE-AT-0066]|nr:hypothetical protein BKA62DRAFT_290392 [Auriculariales sp. MPI-PUGE-AT-0066]